MERIFFADGWRDFFAEHGFRSFNDFFSYKGGRGIHTGGKRSVHRLTLGKADKGKVIYIKRFNYPHFKEIVGSWIRFGRPMSQAAVEWENTNYLLDRGIGTYRAVCFGERMILGIERKSFIVSKEVEGPCLTEFLGERWSGLGKEQKEELMRGLGRFVRRIHKAGINFPDLYVWHIFVQEGKTDGEYDFSIIDLYRMEQNVKDRDKQVRNLGRLEYSMLDKYFDEGLRHLFLESYAGDEWPGGIDGLASDVKRYSKKILGRRNQKQY